MPSCKVVFFVPPDVEGCHLLKELFQDKYGMHSGIDEGLVFDYISHKINVTSMDLKVTKSSNKHLNEDFQNFLAEKVICEIATKLFLVPDLEKYEKFRPLYFTNVHTFVVVFDVAKWSLATLEKICQDLELHQSNSKMVFLGYKKDDEDINFEIFDFISSHKGIYLEFSGHDDLEFNVEYLFQNLDEPNAKLPDL